MASHGVRCASVCVIVLLACLATSIDARYAPFWLSLDSRPLPQWYDDAKFGIFIHWGVFSVPSFGNEWFWKYLDDNKTDYVNFMRKNYPPNFKYQDFAPQFTAEFFNAKQWAELFQAAGAKYVVLTTKHHEGFCNWNTTTSWNWNSVDVGPKRDLVGELSQAIRSYTDLHFGTYFSLFEWFNPLFADDWHKLFFSQEYVNAVSSPQLQELVERYEPDIIWADGDNGPDYYWNSTNFLAWLYNDSPVRDTVVVNDRWGVGVECTHGGVFTCTDRYLPDKPPKHKWENAMTIDKGSWGYRRDAKLEDYLTSSQLIAVLVETVSKGGNLLMNIGPTRDGIIMPIFEERLRDIGQWLSVNGEAIYSTRPWHTQNDTITPNVWYTAKSQDVYAVFLEYPGNENIVLGVPKPSTGTTITLIGTGKTLSWKKHPAGGVSITWPALAVNQLGKWAWVLKLQNVT